MSVTNLSNYYLPTRKEEPREAEIISHKLMLRAGLIRRLTRGVYSYLPLGWRVLKKIEDIVREEMDRAGGMEVLMPILQPRELWEETGRWDVYGPEMLRLEDRHQGEYGLGPTHEEVITDLVADEVDSYRDCPLLFYQIATKFRDEIRPRFGLMRGREFNMKDAYSFDVDEESARETYRRMETAYRRIFDRIGLEYRQVEADTGAIGGSLSHEFMVPAQNGEDEILSCRDCDYAANREQAEGQIAVEFPEAGQDEKELEKFATPGVETIEDLLQIDDSARADRQVKTMVMLVDETPTALLLPGDYQLNETKLGQAAEETVAEMSPGEIADVFGAHPGSLGAVNLEEAREDVRVWADPALEGRYNLYTGANEDGYHFRGVSMERDIEVDRWVNLRLVKPEEKCVECGGAMEAQSGIEVGHIFYLGTKYSDALEATVQKADGRSAPLVMGCYGIGTSRIIGAAIEQSHDEQGIIWPPAIAPFHVYLLPVNVDNEEQMSAARKIADELDSRGVEVVVDDRDESVGYKFNESELIGIPLRITFGRDLSDGKVEFYSRLDDRQEVIPLEDCAGKVVEELDLNG